MSRKIEISKEGLYEMYIAKNRTRNDIATNFNCSLAVIKKKLNEYNIIKDKKQAALSQQESMLKKYGVRFSAQNKESIEKMKQTNLKKYGATCYLQSNEVKDKIKQCYNVDNVFRLDEIKEKIKQTNLEKYGVENVLSKESPIRKNVEQTNLERYGNKVVLKNTDIINKIKETKLEKYGTCNGINIALKVKELENKETLKEYLKLQKEPTLLSISKDLTIPYSTVAYFIDKYELNHLVKYNTSYLEEDFKKFLDTLNIPYKTHDRTVIKPQELDFYFPDYNLAIEFNDIASHNSTLGYITSEVKPKDYHYNKSKACEEVGVRLIHIYEYEWFNERQRPILENIITGALGLNKTIYARKCNIVIKPSKEMRDFFNTNNIQGFRPGKFAICLEYDGRIVMAYMMGSAYFGKGKYEWEVIRGATELGINVVGGASKIWKYFIDNYNPNNCVYYIDYNYFNGNSMKNIPNMQFIKTQLSFKNYFVETKEVKNRNPYKHKEIAELYKEGKVIQIYNAGTKVYLWTKSKE